MPKFLKLLRLNQKGVIHLIPLFLILIGIIAGVYLVQHPQIFKPKADAPTIQWVPRSSENDPDNCVTGVDQNGYAIAVCSKLKLKFNLPAQSSDAGFQFVKTAYANHPADTEDFYCQNNQVWHSEYRPAWDLLGWFSDHSFKEDCSKSKKICVTLPGSGTGQGKLTQNAACENQLSIVSFSTEDSAGQSKKDFVTGDKPFTVTASALVRNNSGDYVEGDQIWQWFNPSGSWVSAETVHFILPPGVSDDIATAILRDKNSPPGTYRVDLKILDMNGNKISESSTAFQVSSVGKFHCGFASDKDKIYDQNSKLISDCASTNQICVEISVPVTVGSVTTAKCADNQTVPTPTGVGTTEPAASQVTPSPTPAAGGIKVVCDDKKETYGQCGNTDGLEGKDPTHEFEVTKVTDCNGRPKPYLIKDNGPSSRCPQDSGSQTITTPSTAPTATTAPIASRKIVKYRYKVSYPPIKESGWINITGGDIAIDAENASPGTQTIYFEFADSNGQIVEIDGKSTVAAYVIFIAPGTTTTPTPTMTPTAAPQATVTPTPAGTGCTAPQAPTGLGYDKNSRTVFWNKVEGASAYNVRLVDPAKVEHDHDDISNTWYTFPASEVSAVGSYSGWVDAFNQCGVARGGFSFTNL